MGSEEYELMILKHSQVWAAVILVYDDTFGCNFKQTEMMMMMMMIIINTFRNFTVPVEIILSTP